jgi:hypothetical protein
MAIEPKTIDIILATASVVIFIIVFFFIFQFRKMDKTIKDQEKKVGGSFAAMPVEMIYESIRHAAPEQIKIPEKTYLKLEDIFPEQPVSYKPGITVTQVSGFSDEETLPEIQPGFCNGSSDIPDDIKPSQYENTIDENSDLRLEDELPEKSDDVEISELNIEISEPAKLKFEETIPEIQPGFCNGSSDKPDDIKPSQYENTIDENSDLRLEDELPEKSNDLEISELNIEISEPSKVELEETLPGKLNDSRTSQMENQQNQREMRG